MMRFIMMVPLVPLVLHSATFAATSPAAGCDHSIWDGHLYKHVLFVRRGQATQVNYAKFKTDDGSLETGYRLATGQLAIEFSDDHRHLNLVVEPRQSYTL